MRAIPRVSIIIPARNDAAALRRTLDHLQGLPGMEAAEVIVVASGDPAGTERAVAGRARILWPAGSARADLMNAGAAAAGGEALFFLHADSFPPANAFALIQGALADPGVVGGAFEHLFAEPVWSLRAITWINRLRYRLTRNYYGDQGIFVRAAAFRQMGGYRPLEVLEDLDFTQRLQQRGRSVLVRVPMRTSGRRFLVRGPVRTFCFIVWLLTLHTLRLDTQRYAERWRGPADQPPGAPLPRRRTSPCPARLLLLACLCVALSAPAGAASGPSPFVEELKTLHAHYHTDPARPDVVLQGLEQAVKEEPNLENLLARAQVSFIWGAVRATTREQKLEAYEQGRDAAQRAIALNPKSALAHFWYAANSGRLGQTRGILRSLFGLMAVKEAIRTALELDPKLTAAYILAGYVAYEVPGILGGDLDKAEGLFRKGLEQDPMFTGMRVGLAKTLIKKGRIAEARRELQGVLDETHPSNPADWTLKDSKEARELLDAISDTS